MNEKLNTGNNFPNLSLTLIGGGTVELPTAPDDGYQVVLFYRGGF